MHYLLEGTFVESCDCASICPCWLDDKPDAGHCTGMFAWSLGRGSRVGDADVAGLTVVAVTEHPGARTEDGSVTTLFVDAEAGSDRHDLLVRAFSGDLDGPLHALQAVTGRLDGSYPAQIAFCDGSADGGWSITVRVEGSRAVAVAAKGATRVFLDDATQPLTLEHTALDRELGIRSGVTALATATLDVRVASLPVGYLSVTGTSGMRGRFAYRHESAGG